MKMFFGILGVFLVLIIFMAWASYPWSIQGRKETSEVKHIEPEIMVHTEEYPSVIKILTWNIGYLYGEGSEGSDYTFKDKTFYEEKLNQMIKEISEWQPDVICFQEIDFHSSRSHFMNQAEIIAARAGYPYVAEAASWKANYIPFPYWPFSNHFKSVDSGGAVLSKYPIINNEIELLAKPMSQPWWYNLFYLHRYVQKITLELGEKKFQLLNLHLEAFDKVDRQEQAKLLVKRIQNESIDFIAGDFNMVPMNAQKKSKFANEDDYENDKSQEILNSSGLKEVIPNEIYDKDEGLYFTFPSSKPDRRLDYIYYHSQHKMMKAEILPSALSGHLPLRATFQIASPKFNPYSQ